jgi:hypothetical protein
VVKANSQVVAGCNYYITFKAEDASNGAIQTFQTLVYNGIGFREVTFIWIKPLSNQGIKLIIILLSISFYCFSLVHHKKKKQNNNNNNK